MFKIFGRAVLLLLAFLMIPCVIGFFLSRDYTISAQITIDAPQEIVFENLNSLKEWRHWSPWNSESVEGLTVQLSGAESGKGAVQTWEDPRGKGKLWITESAPPMSLAYQMEFAHFPEMDSRFDLEETDQKTTVKWTSKGTLPSGPFYGWFQSLFAHGLQQEYDKGLAKLKSYIESSH